MSVIAYKSLEKGEGKEVTTVHISILKINS